MKATVINLESRPERMIDFQKNNFPFEVERFNAFKTDPGWIGCANSHLTIMKEQKEYPFIIFEDDSVLIDSWDKVENAMLQLPPDWDALWLGASHYQFVERYSQNLFRVKGLYCNHSIIYNSKTMIDYYITNYNNLPEKVPLDVFSANILSHNFNCFLINPMIVKQAVGYSDIENKVVDYAPWFNNLQNILNTH
jgi:GR25 family glycosyltransferase involved in LPS biosynthesis